MPSDIFGKNFDHAARNISNSACHVMQNDAKEAAFKRYIVQTEERLLEVQQLLDNQSRMIDEVTTHVEAAQSAASNKLGGTK